MVHQHGQDRSLGTPQSRSALGGPRGLGHHLPTRRAGLVNAATFPGRALTVMQKDVGPLQSLRSERFSYVAEETVGHCLDIGCGPENRFISLWHPDGLGIDVFPYEGLT